MLTTAFLYNNGTDTHENMPKLGINLCPYIESKRTSKKEEPAPKTVWKRKRKTNKQKTKKNENLAST
jgi:hypothetical protein